MPLPQRVRRHDRGDRPRRRATYAVRASRQPASVRVREPQPWPVQLTPKELVLLDEVGDGLPLPALKPAGQHAEHHLQGGDADHSARAYITGRRERRRPSCGTLRRPELPTEQPVFDDQVGDDFAFAVLEPTGEHQEQPLESRSVEHERQLISRSQHADRIVGHYACPSMRENGTCTTGC